MTCHQQLQQGDHTTASSPTACELPTWPPLNLPSAGLVAIDKEDPGGLQVLQAGMNRVGLRSANSRRVDSRPALRTPGRRQLQDLKRPGDVHVLDAVFSTAAAVHSKESCCLACPQCPRRVSGCTERQLADSGWSSARGYPSCRKSAPLEAVKEDCMSGSPLRCVSTYQAVRTAQGAWWGPARPVCGQSCSCESRQDRWCRCLSILYLLSHGVSGCNSRLLLGMQTGYA